MANPYEYNYGTSFGFSKTQSTGMKPIVNGIYTDAHSFRDFGLYPKEKPVIETPEVQVTEIEVPGRDGRIDTSELLDGIVHYYNRQGTFKFSQIGGRETWDSTYALLKKKLHGKRKQIVIDEEPDGYYEGRITVEEPEYDSERKVAYFELSANLEPFKYRFMESDEDWLWDPFSFINGVINEACGETQITNSGTVTIIGGQNAVVPNIIVSNISGSHFYVSYPGHTGNVELFAGDNLDNTPDLILKDDEDITLTFTGTAKVRIKFRAGVL